MHLVALVESAAHVCCRYRVSAYADYRRQAGDKLSVRELPRSPLARLKLLRSVRDADAVVVQRKLLSWLDVAVLRAHARKLIYDFDDAVWLRDSYSPKGFHSARRVARFRNMIRSCDLVVAGNPYLAEEAGRFNPAVAVIPTCVEPDEYESARHRKSRAGVRLVWIGSSSTLKGLERNRDTLEAIGRAVPGARLKVICDRFPALEHLPVDAVPWSEFTEAAELADADVGIGWVPDDPWSRGKCGLKVLQYQAAGLAVVANGVGVQADMVRTGETGIRADTRGEWVNAVRTLAEKPLLRRRLGRAGREQVARMYSVAAGGASWDDAFHRLGLAPARFFAVPVPCSVTSSASSGRPQPAPAAGRWRSDAGRTSGTSSRPRSPSSGRTARRSMTG